MPVDKSRIRINFWVLKVLKCNRICGCFNSQDDRNDRGVWEPGPLLCVSRREKIEVLRYS